MGQKPPLVDLSYFDLLNPKASKLTVSLLLTVLFSSQVALQFSCIESIIDGKGGRHKDAANHIKATGEFVVNMISEPFVEVSK